MTAHSDLAAVRRVMAAFQEGYLRRDPARLDDFMTLFSADAELEVIGTGALEVGQGEWCLGPAMVRELVMSDWQGWGDLRLDLENARVRLNGDTAWLATGAAVSTHIDRDKACQDYLDFAAGLARDDSPAVERLLRMMQGAAGTLYEVQRGEVFTWPLRFTAVLTREA